MAAGKGTSLEPLRFERIPLEKVWGGRALERAPGIALPGTGPIGETWELSDRDEPNSVVACGRFEGRRLRELMTERGSEILGRARRARDGSFPLLVKLLDATESLSVQVHPHGAIADRLPPGDAPKTECWYILDAERDGAVYLGPRPRVDIRTFAAHAAGEGVLELLEKHVVRAGDFVFVPGGTVHAIGAGVRLVEVQETSDTTYRLYDWGRVGLDGRPRAVHVEPALRAIRFEVEVVAPRRADLRERARGVRADTLVDCPEFAVELVEIEGALASDTEDRALIYVALAGHGRITVSTPGGDAAGFALAPGDTWLVPACIGRHRVESQGLLRILRVETKG